MTALALLALPTLCRAQPQVLTFHSDIDDSEQPYAIYLPKDLDPARKYPLLISLHAEDANHRLNLRRVFGRGLLGAETEGEAARRFPAFPDVPFVVACPLARGAMGYRGIAEKDVYAVLADVERRYPIDEDRVYLTGISIGGGGALWLGLTRPDLWAAVVPVSAQPPPGIDELAGNALDLPVLLFHGEQDPLVPAEWARRLQKRFLSLAVPVEYTEYPVLRHNTWDRVYRNGAIFTLLPRFQRRRFPGRVRFVTLAYKYDTAYWLRVDRLTPGQPATIDAVFTGPNRVQVTTRDLDAFTLRLDGHPQYKFSRTAPLVVTIDGAAIHPRSGNTVSFLRTARGWSSVAAPAPPLGKRPGLEGPMAEAVAARHLYVYGTADHPAAEELRKRRDIATAASNWSTPRAHLQVSFAARADRDVTAADLAGVNLVLFGTRLSNSVIARFADRLPIELNPSAADYGLAFVAPIDGHYVLVNSGLPWWTGAAQMKRSEWRLFPAPYHVLESFGDYILFKGSLEHVVAEGRFDSNWSLPAAAAQPMLATGAVTISACCQKNSAATATK